MTQPPGESDPSSLASLFDLGSDESNWPSSELAEILVLLLAAPLEVELNKVIPDEAAFARSFTEGALPHINTFSDLFQHSNSPIELVEIVQSFAQWHLKTATGTLPAPVAKMIACGSIAVHLVRCKGALADLDLPTAKSGLQWAQKQDWLPTWLAALLNQAMQLCEGDNKLIESTDENPSNLQIPGYRIEGQLGLGGMGIVWRAIQKSTRRPVALKLI